MTSRLGEFRVALRKFGPFESALAKQWGDFEHLNGTGLELHAVARELPRLRNWTRLAAIIDRMVLEAIGTAKPTAGILRQAQARADELALAPGP